MQHWLKRTVIKEKEYKNSYLICSQTSTPKFLMTRSSRAWFTNPYCFSCRFQLTNQSKITGEKEKQKPSVGQQTLIELSFTISCLSTRVLREQEIQLTRHRKRIQETNKKSLTKSMTKPFDVTSMTRIHYYKIPIP